MKNQASEEPLVFDLLDVAVNCEFSPDVAARVRLLRYLQEGLFSGNATAAIMRFDSLDILVVMRLGTDRVNAFYGEWDGDPKL
jgi:hypothetical protein